MILGSRSSLSSKTDCIGTDHLWRHRAFSTLVFIIFTLPVEASTAPVESIKHLTQDVLRFDLGLIQPKTID